MGWVVEVKSQIVGRLQPCGCGHPPTPSLAFYGAQTMVDEHVQYRAEPQRDVERAGSVFHPRFHHGTSLRLPPSPTCGPSPFGKNLGRGAAGGPLFSLRWSRALFQTMSSWHATTKAYRSKLGRPASPSRPRR